MVLLIFLPMFLLRVLLLVSSSWFFLTVPLMVLLLCFSSLFFLLPSVLLMFPIIVRLMVPPHGSLNVPPHGALSVPPHDSPLTFLLTIPPQRVPSGAEGGVCVVEGSVRRAGPRGHRRPPHQRLALPALPVSRRDVTVALQPDAGVP